MPSPLEAIIEQVVHSLNAEEEPSFGVILQTLYRLKFDGAITLHCHAGVPRIIEMGRMIRFDLSRKGSKPLTDSSS